MLLPVLVFSTPSDPWIFAILNLPGSRLGNLFFRHGWIIYYSLPFVSSSLYDRRLGGRGLNVGISPHPHNFSRFCYRNFRSPEHHPFAFASMSQYVHPLSPTPSDLRPHGASFALLNCL